MKKASFLKEWGATITYGDLKLPETIPKNFKGIKAVIDASTLRLDDNIAKIEEIDLLGKLCLVKAAKSANIKNFIFFSITENDHYKSILLMKLNLDTLLVTPNKAMHRRRHLRELVLRRQPGKFTTMPSR